MRCKVWIDNAEFCTTVEFMAIKSPLYRLADALLKAQGHEGLRPWVYERRMRLQPRPWGAIAADLAEATDNEVSITSVALREWFAEEMAAERLTEFGTTDGPDDSTELKQDPLFHTGVSEPSHLAGA